MPPTYMRAPTDSRGSGSGFLLARDGSRPEAIDCPEAYLVVSAEASQGGTIASFDRAIDRVPSISAEAAGFYPSTTASIPVPNNPNRLVQKVNDIATGLDTRARATDPRRA
jgi:hypothetical protein